MTWLRTLSLFATGLPVFLPAQSVPTVRLQHTLPGSGPVRFGVVQEVALAPDGGVVVLDISHVRLYRFTASGALRDSLGRQGRGPGETQIPGSLVLTEAGMTGVSDLATMQVAWWRPDGLPAGVLRLDGRQGLDLRRGGSGAALLKTVEYRQGLVEFVEVVPGAEAIGTSRAAFSATPAPASRPLSCLTCPWVPWPGGGVVVAAPDTAYQLTLLQGREAVRSWARAVGPRRRTGAEVAELAERLRRGPGGVGGAGPEGRVGGGAPTVPPFHPRVRAVDVDARGRLWVLAQNAGEARPVLDLFDPGGGYLGTIRVPHALAGFRVSGTRLVGWGEDEAGEPAVWVYQVGG